MISAMKERSLVLAPSNAAVANIALKLWAQGGLELEDIIVHGSNSDPSVHFLNPPARGIQYSTLVEAWKKERDASKRDIILREFVEWLKIREDHNLTLAELGHMCPFFELTCREGRAQYQQSINQAKVLLCTLNSAGSKTIQDNFSAHTIFLDEACQCPEAEFYIVTSFPRVKRVVVMGDPQQLPSTVLDRTCKDFNYGSSWLESVYETNPDKIHLLDTQYRMDPLILKFPNMKFYDNLIQCGRNVLSRNSLLSKPFVFVDTDSGGHEELDSFSWKNIFEVTVVKSILMTDSDITQLLKSTRGKRVIVITPYKAQVQLLRSALKLPYPDHTLEVNTVDSFQGQEGDVVVLSTVRTHKVGFVDDRQRLNVAVTRAKSVLRVVGDAKFFSSLSQSSTLRALVEFSLSCGVLEKTKVRTIPWSPPNWSCETFFKPVMTVRFLECVSRCHAFFILKDKK